VIQGTDISAWQDANETARKVDFDRMWAAGAQFCFMRAQFGLAQDQDFADYWRGCKGKLARGAYYFPIVKFDMAAQTQQFIDILKPDRGELPPVIDIEPYNGLPNAKSIKLAIGMIEAQLKVKPIIYTGYYVWRDNIGVDKFFASYPLWIATYGQAPMIPAPWTEWTYWQYTDKGDGLKYGVESKNIDLDYCNMSQEAFNAMTGSSHAIPVPQEIKRVRIGRYNVNLRSTPLLADNKLGVLLAGTEFDVIEHRDGWVNVGGWIKLENNGQKLVEVI